LWEKNAQTGENSVMKRILRFVNKFLPRPKGIIFEVTPRCNLDCLFCYNVWKSNADYPAGELDTSAAIRVLQKAVTQSSCDLVTLSGGEPFMRGDIPEICAFVNQLGPSVNIITNGTLLDREIIKECLGAGVKIFEFPLLSADREIHNALARRNAFDKVVESIAQVRSLGGRVATSFIATKNNLHTIRETLELNAALQVDGILLNRFNPGGEGIKHAEELLPDLNEFTEALAAADDAAKRFDLNISCSIPIQPCLVDRKKYRNLFFGDCPLGTGDMYFTIDPVGNLRPCNHSSTILGSLCEESFDELTDPERLKHLTRAKPRVCEGCKQYRKCRSGCKAAAEVCYGSATEPEPFLKKSLHLVGR